MAQWLRVLTIHAKDPDSILSTHMTQKPSVTLVSGDLKPPPDL